MTTKNMRVIIVAAIVAALLGGGVATAKTLIRSSDIASSAVSSSKIKNSSILGKDIKNRTISIGKLSSGTQALIRGGGSAGAAGPAGPAGARGATGATGAAGATGATGAAGAKGDDGAAGKDGAAGTAGKDGVAGTPGKDAPVTKTEFGVARLFQGTKTLGSVWTSDVPDDGNNAAQVAASVPVVVTGATDNVVTLRGVFRSSEQTSGTAGQIGASLIATAPDGSLAAAPAQTPANPDFKGVAVVNVNGVEKTSDAPASDATTIVTLTLPTTPGVYIVQGNVQAFDFGVGADG